MLERDSGLQSLLDRIVSTSASEAASSPEPKPASARSKIMYDIPLDSPHCGESNDVFERIPQVLRVSKIDLENRSL